MLTPFLILALTSVADSGWQEQVSAPGGPAAAEQIDQIGGGAQSRAERARSTTAPQLAPEGDGPVGSVRPAEAEAARQLTDVARSADPVPQLSRNLDRRVSPQLYQGGRTAQPAQALSAPAEGRTAVTAVVDGVDRCDTVDAAGRAPAGCDRVIETRSAEFARPDPTELSPEQRLLIEQRNRTLAGELAAAQRLATATGNPDEIQDQEIASQVLRNGLPAPAASQEEEPALSAELQAVLQGVVNALTAPR